MLCDLHYVMLCFLDNVMDEFIEKHKEIWGNDPTSLLEKYDYHLELTKKLDALSVDDFNREILYEIVLWKLSRFPYINDALLNKLKGIADIEPTKHESAREVLENLLRSSGVALPMASTILRFINPKSFQIIDDRAYRVLFPGQAKYPSKPAKITNGYIKNSIDIYFQYLDKLHEVSSKKLPFEKADRILYQLDILLGNTIGSSEKT